MTKKNKITRVDKSELSKQTLLSSNKKSIKIDTTQNKNGDGVVIDIVETIPIFKTGTAFIGNRGSQRVREGDVLHVTKTLYYDFGECDITDELAADLTESFHDAVVLLAIKHIKRIKKDNMFSIYGDLKFTPGKGSN